MGRDERPARPCGRPGPGVETSRTPPQPRHRNRGSARDDSSVTVWVARFAGPLALNLADFPFQGIQEPLEPPGAQTRPVSAGNGRCGSRRQKAAASRAAFFSFHYMPATPAPHRVRGGSSARKAIAPAVHTLSLSGPFFGSSRARGLEKPGRFFLVGRQSRAFC
jgi:hypothetical protein